MHSPLIRMALILLPASSQPTPIVQHASLESRDKDHLQENKAQWSRTLKVTRRKISSFPDNTLRWTTTSAPPREDFSLQEGKPRIPTCILEGGLFMDLSSK